MSQKKSLDDNITFERAMQDLETIVTDLEDGNLTLDDALSKFEAGIRLSRVCTQKLEQAEKKIEMLLASEEGEFILKAVELGESEHE